MKLRWNYKTCLFCFFVGSVLSIPFGLLRNRVWESYTPPSWSQDLAVPVTAISFAILPFWSCFTFSDNRSIWCVGLAISLVVLYLVSLPAT